MPKAPFSLVSTVFNEMKRLDQTIADIEAQTLKPSEILITDAGSKDGTYDRLIQWRKESSIPIVVLQKAKCNVAEGRNIAIAAAKYPLIASTDFGCRFSPNWLEDLMAPFWSDANLDVVGGGFTIIKSEVNNLPTQADYLLSNGYKISFDQYFSTSSRSIAYKKYVWERIGGYPEWLTLAADDTIFWRLIKHFNFRFEFAETPNVFWLRHKTFLGFAKESYRYGLGDGESTINFKNFLVLTTEGILRITFAVSLAVYAIGCFTLWPLLILALFCLAGFRGYKYAFTQYLKFKEEKFPLKVLLASFFLLEKTRYYYTKGYLKGWLSPTPLQKEKRKALLEIIH